MMRLEERGEAAEGVGSQRLVLAVHERDRLDLLVAGGEMAVPEESQLLAERVGAVEDAVEPADLEQVDVRRGPRRLAKAVDRLGVLGGELWWVEQIARRWPSGPACEVAQQFGAGRAEAGAAVQVGDFAKIPGVVGRWLVPGPG